MEELLFTFKVPLPSDVEAETILLEGRWSGLFQVSLFMSSPRDRFMFHDTKFHPGLGSPEKLICHVQINDTHTKTNDTMVSNGFIK